MATITTAQNLSAPIGDRLPLARGKLWHRTAPAAVARHCRLGRPGRGWDAWTSHLTARAGPKPIADLVEGPPCPTGWNLPDDLDPAGLVTALSRLSRLRGQRNAPAATWPDRLEQWLAEASCVPADAAAAVESVAIGHHLPQLANWVPADLWWELLERLLAAAAGAATLVVTDNPLLAQLAGGELPLTLAYLFPEIRACRQVGRDGRRALSVGLAELLDGAGLPHGRYVPAWGPLLACWTRCRAIGGVLKRGCWNGDAEGQYQWLITQTLRFTRRDGTLMFSNGSAGAWAPGLLATALALAGDDGDAAAARKALPRHSKKMPGGKKRETKDLPEPTVNSEWSGLAVLRPDWSRSARRLAVDYSGRAVQVELNCGRDVVFSGTWAFEFRQNGAPLWPTGAWEEVCWVSDETTDYLELESELHAGVRIQRQILLARADDFLFLADVFLSPSAGKMEYRGALPLGPAVSYRPAKETREGYLAGRKPRGLVLPLSLPEWRLDPRGGSLRAVRDTLELSCLAEGRRLCCPLFIDLHPRRMMRQRTWRQLTVAASLKVEPADVAVGYRVQCGQDQWLIYRALAQPASRSVLGQNLSSDFLMSRFLRTGEIEEIVEIE